MSGRDPVGSIGRPSDSGSTDAEGPKFIWCVDGQEPQIHEVWDFGEDGVTHEVHLTEQVDVGTGVVGEFATNYLNESWRRVPIFGRIPINVSVEWLDVTDFHRSYGTAWTSNLLDPCSIWEVGGISTKQKWGIQSGGYYRNVSIPWNFPIRVLPVYHRRILENMRGAARHICDNQLQINHLTRMLSPLTSRNLIHNQRVNL